MSKLVICEKPSVAKSIASVLGVTSRADGYFEGNGYLISWCIGHLVGLADAAAYDDRYKSGGMRTLPFCPTPSAMWCPRKRPPNSTFSDPRWNAPM